MALYDRMLELARREPVLRATLLPMLRQASTYSERSDAERQAYLAFEAEAALKLRALGFRETTRSGYRTWDWGGGGRPGLQVHLKQDLFHGTRAPEYFLSLRNTAPGGSQLKYTTSKLAEARNLFKAVLVEAEERIKSR